MKLEEIILVESPYSIPDLDWHDLNDPNKNKAGYAIFCGKKYQYKHKLMQLTENAAVYNQGTEYFCLDYESKRITYYMKNQVANKNFLGGNFAWQSMVWADPSKTSKYLSGIPKKIFWEHLFKKYGTVVTDSEQTWHGRRFWEIRIAEALDNNINVYFCNFATKFIKKLEKFDDLNEYQLEYNIWGTQKGSDLKRMVITNKDLIKKE
jgi:hypothetical protein